MNIVHLPDDPAMPEFLERQLVGDRLALVVSELAERPGAMRAAGSLFQHWDDVTTALVLQHGLTRLPKETLRQLVKQPEYLLHLQERVLLDGGPFWDQIPRTPGIVEAHERGRHVLLNAPLPVAAPASPARERRSRGVGYGVLTFATAAAVLLGVFLGTRLIRPETPRPEQPAFAWGWSKPHVTANDVPAPAYLNRLAEAAAEWHAERPNDTTQLAKRLHELRANCTVLLLAEHQPLTDADRTWLRERCRAWATTFDQQLVALEAGTPPADVRTVLDTTIDKLTAALRQRATQAQS